MGRRESRAQWVSVSVCKVWMESVRSDNFSSRSEARPRKF